MTPYYRIDTPKSSSLENNERRVLVTSDSPLKQKKHLEQLAYYFRREQHFDVVQYLAAEDEEQPHFIPYHGWIFTGMPNRITDDAPDSHYAIGGCCFRLRTNEKDSKHWSLSWIWFHPYHRSRGNLSHHWPFLQKKYGDFSIDQPISPSMRGFLQKQNQPRT